jgi:hypothetical protein
VAVGRSGLEPRTDPEGVGGLEQIRARWTPRLYCTHDSGLERTEVQPHSLIRVVHCRTHLVMRI